MAENHSEYPLRVRVRTKNGKWIVGRIPQEADSSQHGQMSPPDYPGYLATRPYSQRKPIVVAADEVAARADGSIAASADLCFDDEDDEWDDEDDEWDDEDDEEDSRHSRHADESDRELAIKTLEELFNEYMKQPGDSDKRWEQFWAKIRSHKTRRASKKLLDSRDKLWEQGIRIMPVGHSLAARLTFPSGHPRDNVFYVGHPTVATVYYPAAQFHRLTFEHKFVECARLLRALGAREIVVLHVRGWDKRFTIDLNANAIVGGVSTEVKGSSRSQSGALYWAKFGGAVQPALPDDLVWYPHEPSWQEIAAGRLRYGLKEFSLGLHYEDDYGVNAQLRTHVFNCGLDLGGNFVAHESTIWKISGTFA